MTSKHGSLRDRILLGPFEFALVGVLAILAVVFTIFPEALAHSPVSFEERGIIHHLWHYGLLLGSLLTLAGFTTTGGRSFLIELIGLMLLLMCFALNLSALIFAELDAPGLGSEMSGLDAALRVAAMVGIGLRIWIILSTPLVRVRIESVGSDDA